MAKSVVIPSSPEDQKRIKNCLQTISDSYTRIEAEKDLIKDEIAALAGEFEIPKKFLAKMARTFHKQNYQDNVDEQDDFEQLYEAVVKPEVQ